MMHWFGYNGFGMGFGWVFMILFWGVFIFVIISLVRKSGSSEKEETAEDILKNRYVRGEISQDEFEAIKKDLDK